MASAYLLVSHGSRDPRPELAMQQLARLVSHKLPGHDMLSIATLELSPQPLHEQIQQFAQSALACGCDELNIVPLFLLPGIHLTQDIPAEVQKAQVTNQDIVIKIQPYLGSHPDFGQLIAQPLAKIKVDASILLAHGSRRQASQQQLNTIAENLGAVAAFWAVPPSLETKVQELVNAGHQKIAILSYFLFAGGITDAIAESVERLKLKFPGVDFQLTAPLGASPELADLIWDLLNS